jgi:hypothetical protein
LSAGLKALIGASFVRFGIAQRHKRVNSKPNRIKPAFAPETEFQVETLTIVPEDQADEDPVCSENLDLCTQTEFTSWPRNSWSALND